MRGEKSESTYDKSATNFFLYVHSEKNIFAYLSNTSTIHGERERERKCQGCARLATKLRDVGVYDKFQLIR